MEKGQWENARQKTAQSKDPLAAKLYHWRLFSKAEDKEWEPGLFMRLAHFIRQNPDWPGMKNLRLRAEKVMPENLGSQEIVAWFDEFPPQTSEGIGRYLDALIIEGRQKDAQKRIADWWADTLVSRELQTKIFQRFGQYLTFDAHKKRFDALLSNGHYTNARAIAGVLGQGYPELAEARIALMEKKSGVNALINKVPSYLQNDAGLLYLRLKWRREKGDDAGAIEILRAAPDPQKVRNPEDWWKERHIVIRRMLEKGQYKTAFELADKHMQTEGLAYAQAQWLAGWLALRFMKQPTQAFERFTALHEKVSTPISKSRAAYWAGRAAEGFNNKEIARDWYKKAAQYFSTYYGQMAIRILSLEEEIPRASVPSLSRADIEKFRKNDLIQAAMLYNAAGETNIASSFLQAFANEGAGPKAYRFGAELSAKMDHYHDAVKIAKRATDKGLFLTSQAYPLVSQWVRDDSGVELAFIHALIRQESMFDRNATSSAGAKGLMQLMPGTAKETAKKENISYRPDWLTDRPDYNIRLGSAYMSRLLERYDNSYALATAAYNAGPGNVDKWLNLFGDPRNKEIDLLDWIELIPIYETRNYVQRVMENLYVYRILMKNPHTASPAIRMVDKINP